MIKKVENANQFNGLVKKYFSKSFSHNASRLIRDYKQFITSETLFFMEEPSYLFFLEDRGDFYNLYYFIDKSLEEMDTNILPKENTIVLDHIYKRKTEDWGLKLLRDCGFSFYLRRYYQTLALSSVESDFYRRKEPFFASKKDLSKILSLQNSSIDLYTGNRLNKEEIEEEIDRRNILGIYDKDTLVGYLRFKTDKKTVTLENIVIDKAHRGKGLSIVLMEDFIIFSHTMEYNKIDLWVREDNSPALRLYDKFNFKNAGYICDNYIK